ncbi:MAG: hypothetical protein H6747_01450 [Deltaproteobacteria bacterium]|nr:hypothetical protein [Deltaproteobacteria bacterium]
MPSPLHELIVDLFRRDPTLATWLLREVLGVDLPVGLDPVIAEPNFSEFAPTEARTDLLVAFGRESRTELILILEVQLGRDDDKRWRWPYYLASAAQRWRCPALLLVVTSDAAIARWAATPIEVGGKQMSLTPYVLGPELVPKIQTPQQARQRPYLAVLSALAHGREAGGLAVVEACLAAADVVDDSVRVAYFEIVLGALDVATRRALEAKMSLENFEVQSAIGKAILAKGEARGRAEGEARGRAEGEARGEARGRSSAILAVLRARGLAVSDAERDQISACHDLELLERWLMRAATVTSTAAVLEVGHR